MATLLHFYFHKMLKYLTKVLGRCLEIYSISSIHPLPLVWRLSFHLDIKLLKFKLPILLETVFQALKKREKTSTADN